MPMTFEKKYTRPTVAEVDLSAIAFNFRQVVERVKPAKVMAVVKANAYGHGAVPVSKILLENGADYLGVALVEEGIALREAGIRAPILVFGLPLPNTLEQYYQYDLSCTVCAREHVEWISVMSDRMGKKIHCHLKVDTGMGRVGIPFGEAVSFVKRMESDSNIHLEGLYTHFATSDMEDKSFAHAQLKRFREIIESLEQEGVHIPMKHAANSGAILDMPETFFDMVRPGVMLYGYYPSAETSESLSLRPAMRLKTRVSFVKKLPKDFSVSYGRTYVSDEETMIATLPIGYADGYNRLFSNRGEVIIRGVRYSVVGRVCMDMTMVNVGPNSSVQVGDEAVLLGAQGEKTIEMTDVCRKLNTIPYEVTCWISERVPRIYVHDEVNDV